MPWLVCSADRNVLVVVGVRHMTGLKLLAVAACWLGLCDLPSPPETQPVHHFLQAPRVRTSVSLDASAPVLRSHWPLLTLLGIAGTHLSSGWWWGGTHH